MAQVDDGLRSILSLPAFYRLFEHILGTDRWRAVLVEEHLRPRAGDRILDIGCGPGDVVGLLPRVEYFGFDMNPRYIETARRRYGDRAHFTCQNVNEHTMSESSSFDLALAIGIVHHLDDDEAVALFKLARRVLKPDGRLITLDPCFTDDQPRIARWLATADRGRNIRRRDAYVALATRVFPRVASTVRHNVIRVPTTGIVLDCGS